MNPKQLVRRVLPTKAITLAEESYRKGRVYALQAKGGFPAKGARVIAVTGTNGKTTTCLYINEMLKSAGYKTALYTTAVTEMAGKTSPNTSHRTVPLTAELVTFFQTAKTKQVDFIVLETTSQALDQHKLLGVPVEVAVMTNLTQDHLDYHGTMEKYASAKARLFSSYMQPKKVVLNQDDDWFEFFKERAVGDVTTYGQDAHSQLQINKIATTNMGSQVTVQFDGQTSTFKTSLIGQFNAYNAAAAVSAGLAVGLTLEQAAAGAGKLETAPGRMEPVDVGQDFAVLVDYAHTPDALENALKTLQDVTKGDVLLVFGATGDRDKAKRPIMGKVVAQYADKIFLTDDETYTEDPAMIRKEVMQGILAGKGVQKTTEVGDRREAIQAAFAAAKKGDAVLLAGLGHQDYRAMGGEKQSWDERQIARELLRHH